MGSPSSSFICFLIAAFVFFVAFVIYIRPFSNDNSSPRFANHNRKSFHHGGGSNKNTFDNDVPRVLLISYDGFRWDYLQHADTPNIRWLIKNGVHATQGLLNEFITITAPNHYSIVTGVHEETHGIISNTFYSPVYNETFDYFTTGNKTDPRFFEQGTPPIWILNDNVSAPSAFRASGCMMWVGCDIAAFGHKVKYNQSWTSAIPWETRIDAVISWFTDSTNSINLGLLYIEEPDETGHQYGPSSNITLAMVEKLDKLTGYLLWRLYTVDLLDKVNLIFTADHGMANVPAENMIRLNEYVNNSWYDVSGSEAGPDWNVMPKPGYEDQVFNKLAQVPHMVVYRKEDVPERLHYKNSPNIMPLQFVADLGYEFTNSGLEKTSDGKILKKIHGKVHEFPPPHVVYGAHGYDNTYPEMHPYFVGHGPAFKQGFNVTQFESIDIYPLMAYILNVTPPANNASFDRVKSLLQDEGVRWSHRKHHGHSSHGLSDQSRSMDTDPWFRLRMTSLDFDYVAMAFLTLVIFTWYCVLIVHAENLRSEPVKSVENDVPISSGDDDEMLDISIQPNSIPTSLPSNAGKVTPLIVF